MPGEAGNCMKKGLRRVLSLALAVFTGTAGMAVVPGKPGRAEESVPVMELPEARDGEYAILTVEEDAGIGPHEENYLFETGEKSPHGYADPSITVNIGRGRVYSTDYVYARVKIAFPSQIRTMTSGTGLVKMPDVMAHLLAKRVKAVVAVSGVLLADNDIRGPVKLQGKAYRPDGKTSESKTQKWRESGAMDTLVIDDEGNLRILEGETWGSIQDQIDEMGDSAVNVLAFGPALIVDGEPRYGYTNRQKSTHRHAQRMAICQTGPLEYLLITSAGPEDAGSEGLKLDQFIELIDSFPDVKTAYNLDGGSSSTLVFRKGSAYWAKINGSTGKKRQLKDIIYFADAWLPEE